MKQHKFPVGSVVHGCFPTKPPRPSGSYTVVGQMPERDGHPQYRLESAADGHVRVATEDCLFDDQQSAELSMPATPPAGVFARLAPGPGRRG